MNLSEALETSEYLAASFSRASASTPPLTGLLGFRMFLEKVQRHMTPTQVESDVGVGVGVSPGMKPSDWRIAIRAWNQRELEPRIIQTQISRLRDAVEVRITGPIIALPAVARPVPDTRRHRPLVPGCSIGHHQVSAGTLGAFVRGATGTIQMLSNNHVLANVNGASVGDAILQPGAQDGGLPGADQVGRLSAFHSLQPAGNIIDAAVADIDPGYLPQDFSLPGIGQLQGFLTGVLAGIGPVQKVGRSTGHTHGRITALGLRNLPVKFGQTLLRFNQVVEIEGDSRPFSAPGDSGSLVVNAERKAVGLLFGGTDQSTYINPIENVLQLMKVDLL